MTNPVRVSGSGMAYHLATELPDEIKARREKAYATLRLAVNELHQVAVLEALHVVAAADPDPAP
jgi:hypothetical protein